MNQIFTTTIGKENGINLLNAHIQWHYGATEPTTTYPFQNWADTANNLWKQRNEADSDWITRGTLNEAYFGLALSSTVTSLSNSVIPNNGWTSFSYTFAYTSADDPSYVMTVANQDLTGLIQVGDRFKCTQVTGGTKYFIVTKVELSGSNTLITLFGGTGTGSFDLTNETISNPYFSNAKCPFGFNPNPNIWKVEITDNQARNQNTPTQDQWYNLGSLSLSVPIGLWKINYKVIYGANDDSTQITSFVTLSTANNSESDTELTIMSNFILSGVSNVLFRNTGYCEKFINLTSKTSYYLNTKTSTANAVSITNANNNAPAIIRAVCAYL